MTVTSLLSLLACFVAAFAAYRVYAAYTLRLKAQQCGCQPAARYKHKDPIFGLDIFLRTANAITKNQFLVDHQQRFDTFGHTFEALSFGSRVVYFVQPKNFRAVFSQNAADWGIGPLRLHNMSPFWGIGFITTDGSDSKLSHDLLKPSFHRSDISGLGFLEKPLRALLERSQKTYLDMSTLFLFGKPVGMLSGTSPPHAEGFEDAFQAGVNGCGLRIALGPLNFLMPKGAWLKERDNYRNQISSVEAHPAKTHSRTLLLSMAHKTDDRTVLRNQTVQAMMASMGTTASLISHVVRNLASSSTVCAQVRAEVLVLGDAPLGFDYLPRIKSLQHVILETLRLYPVFPQNNRIPPRDLVLPTGGGPDGVAPVFAAAGTLFDTSFATFHRDPETWSPDANEFRPSRWENGHSPPTVHVHAIWSGARQCLAQQKATMETAYVISRILQEFSDIKSKDDAHGCLVSLTPAARHIVV
ncbi:cytochrome P450 [Xylariaceae sp. FL0804]|nr:cytochrome P450 [Xylariaceae sp. FL0804]